MEDSYNQNLYYYEKKKYNFFIKLYFTINILIFIIFNGFIIYTCINVFLILTTNISFFIVFMIFEFLFILLELRYFKLDRYTLTHVSLNSEGLLNIKGFRYTKYFQKELKMNKWKYRKLNIVNLAGGFILIEIQVGHDNEVLYIHKNSLELIEILKINFPEYNIGDKTTFSMW